MWKTLAVQINLPYWRERKRKQCQGKNHFRRKRAAQSCYHHHDDNLAYMVKKNRFTNTFLSMRTLWPSGAHRVIHFVTKYNIHFFPFFFPQQSHTCGYIIFIWDCVSVHVQKLNRVFWAICIFSSVSAASFKFIRQVSGLQPILLTLPSHVHPHPHIPPGGEWGEEGCHSCYS